MSDMSLNHGLYEATGRRHREVEALVRARAHERALKASRVRPSKSSSGRLRVLTVAAPTIALLGLAAGVNF